MNINYGEIAEISFHNILDGSGVVEEGIVYKYQTDGTKVATDTPEQDIKDEMARVASIMQYKYDRVALYPSFEVQADMQFHDAKNGTTTWVDSIQAIKDAHPKPV